MDEIIELVTQTHEVDDYGDPVPTEETQIVFCRLRSVGQQEFYQAQAVGLKPEVKFVLSDYLDYHGQTCLNFHGERYRVLRTFRSGIELELVCYGEVNPA